MSHSEPLPRDHQLSELIEAILLEKKRKKQEAARKKWAEEQKLREQQEDQQNSLLGMATGAIIFIGFLGIIIGLTALAVKFDIQFSLLQCALTSAEPADVSDSVLEVQDVRIEEFFGERHRDQRVTQLLVLVELALELPHDLLQLAHVGGHFGRGSALLGGATSLLAGALLLGRGALLLLLDLFLGFQGGSPSLGTGAATSLARHLPT